LKRFAHVHQGATQLSMRHLLSGIIVILYDGVKERVHETSQRTMNEDLAHGEDAETHRPLSGCLDAMWMKTERAT
jgi:hypothetical protein